MSLKSKVTELASRFEGQIKHASTEEAVKTAFILPVLNALGYDVFNPAEVIPEFTADRGIKKGEKVDYAVSFDGDVQILIEAKQLGAQLESQHASQLFRYFAVTDAKVAILTDGMRYLFYADLEKPNQMDERPFFEFNFASHTEQDISELSKFSKDSFDVDNILGSANNLKYLKALTEEIKTEFTGHPSDEIVQLFAKRVYDGPRLTAQLKEEFAELVKRAFDTFVRHKIQSKLDSAFGGEDDQQQADEVNSDGIITTPEELEGYRIVQAIAAELVSPSFVYMRDAKSYCAILFDDNNRKPIVRLHFNAKQWYVEVMTDQPEREPISEVRDLYKFKDQILSVIRTYI